MVMGYFRPSNCYNLGKMQEFKDRKYFSISKASERIKKENLKENAEKTLLAGIEGFCGNAAE